MDVEGVYDNLQDYNLGESVHKLQEENQRLSKLVVNLQNDIKKLCENVLEMKKTQDNLAKNISELYKTAKAEIARKDRLIADLRSQIDNHLFRRTKINNYNEIASPRLSHTSSIQQNVEVNKPIKIEPSPAEKDTLVTKADRLHNEYIPVLQDIDMYLPDEKRYALAKRQREERHEDHTSAKRKKNHDDHYDDYNKRNRSGGSNYSRDKRYDDRRFYEDRRIGESSKHSDEHYDRRRRYDEYMTTEEPQRRSKSNDKIKESHDCKEKFVPSCDRHTSEYRRKTSYER